MLELKKKTRKNHVHEHTEFQILGYHELYRSKHELRKVGQNVWK